MTDRGKIIAGAIQEFCDNAGRAGMARVYLDDDRQAEQLARFIDAHLAPEKPAGITIHVERVEIQR